MVMTIESLSKCLKVSRSTLCRSAQEGKLSGQKVGWHWRFHREAVDERLGKSNRPPIDEAGGAKK